MDAKICTKQGGQKASSSGPKTGRGKFDKICGHWPMTFFVPKKVRVQVDYSKRCRRKKTNQINQQQPGARVKTSN